MRGNRRKKVARLPDPQNSCEVFDDFQKKNLKKVTQKLRLAAEKIIDLGGKPAGSATGAVCPIAVEILE